MLKSYIFKDFIHLIDKIVYLQYEIEKYKLPQILVNHEDIGKLYEYISQSKPYITRQNFQQFLQFNGVVAKENEFDYIYDDYAQAYGTFNLDAFLAYIFCIEDIKLLDQKKLEKLIKSKNKNDSLTDKKSKKQSQDDPGILQVSDKKKKKKKNENDQQNREMTDVKNTQKGVGDIDQNKMKTKKKKIFQEKPKQSEVEYINQDFVQAFINIFKKELVVYYEIETIKNVQYDLKKYSIAQVFCEIDTQQKGYIVYEDIRKALIQQNYQISLYEFNLLQKYVAKDLRKVLTFDRFCVILIPDSQVNQQIESVMKFKEFQEKNKIKGKSGFNENLTLISKSHVEETQLIKTLLTACKNTGDRFADLNHIQLVKSQSQAGNITFCSFKQQYQKYQIKLHG